MANYCIPFAITVFWRFGSSWSTSCKHWSVLQAVPAKHSFYARLSIIKRWVIRILRSWFCSLIGLLEWSLCLFTGHEKWFMKCLSKQGNGFLWVWICILSPVLILVKARTSFSFKVSRGERNKLNYVYYNVLYCILCRAVFPGKQCRMLMSYLYLAQWLCCISENFKILLLLKSCN